MGEKWGEWEGLYTAPTYLHERLYTDTASSRYETTSLLLEEHMYAATAHISYKGVGQGGGAVR